MNLAPLLKSTMTRRDRLSSRADLARGSTASAFAARRAAALYSRSNLFLDMNFPPGFEQNGSVLFNNSKSVCHIPSACTPTSKHNYRIQRNHDLCTALHNMNMGGGMIVKEDFDDKAL